MNLPIKKDVLDTSFVVRIPKDLKTKLELVKAKNRIDIPLAVRNFLERIARDYGGK